MDYTSSFDISAIGMSMEKLRVDVTAFNIANANTASRPGAASFKPLSVVVSPLRAGAFDAALGKAVSQYLINGQSISVRENDAAPRIVYDPGNPVADEKGFVAYPNVNPVNEMVNLISATRGYEANIRALEAAKTMALKALEIGGQQ